MTRVNVFEHLRPDEREALLAKLRLLHTLPRARWEEQDVYALTEPLQDTFLVPFTEELNAYILPQPDGTILVDGLVSQERLDETAEQLERLGRL